MKTTKELCDKHGWYLECPECLHPVIGASEYELPSTPLWNKGDHDVCCNCGIHVKTVLENDEITAERDFTKDLVFPTKRFASAKQKSEAAPKPSMRPLEKSTPVFDETDDEEGEDWEDV